MNSEQLLLKLGMPWNGQDPRYLTRAYRRFSLSSEGTGRSSQDLIQTLHVDQIELFPKGTSYGT